MKTRCLEHVPFWVGRTAIALLQDTKGKHQRAFPTFSGTKNEPVLWKNEARRAFNGLKYLPTPPQLTRPELGEELLLYLSIVEEIVSLVELKKSERFNGSFTLLGKH